MIGCGFVVSIFIYRYLCYCIFSRSFRLCNFFIKALRLLLSVGGYVQRSNGPSVVFYLGCHGCVNIGQNVFPY